MVPNLLDNLVPLGQKLYGNAVIFTCLPDRLLNLYPTELCLVIVYMEILYSFSLNYFKDVI